VSRWSPYHSQSAISVELVPDRIIHERTDIERGWPLPPTPSKSKRQPIQMPCVIQPSQERSCWLSLVKHGVILRAQTIGRSTSRVGGDVGVA
jgi:hypothetical protein